MNMVSVRTCGHRFLFSVHSANVEISPVVGSARSIYTVWSPSAASCGSASMVITVFFTSAYGSGTSSSESESSVTVFTISPSSPTVVEDHP